MLEIDGDTQRIATAMTRLEELLPVTAGLLARILAPTDSGMVLFQLWETRGAAGTPTTLATPTRSRRPACSTR